MARTFLDCVGAACRSRSRRSCSWERTSAASRFKVPGSTSTKTGVAPARTIALAEAKKLKAVVITESPGLTPAATSASQSASVPDAHPTAPAAPVIAAISRSSACTSGPRMKLWESHTRSIAASTSSRMPAYCRRKSSSGTDSGAVFRAGVEIDVTDEILAGLLLTLMWCSSRCEFAFDNLTFDHPWFDSLAFDNVRKLRSRRCAGEMFPPLRQLRAQPLEIEIGKRSVGALDIAHRTLQYRSRPNVVARRLMVKGD